MSNRMEVFGHRVLLRGPVLVGFNELFDAAHGDPSTQGPYVKVKPARIGNTLFPYACPHCDAVRPEMVKPETSVGYWDRRRGFSWCPRCRKRYILDGRGAPLSGKIEIGATHAPAIIERNGKTVIDAKPTDGFKLLG
jgi:hypothetical protein